MKKPSTLALSANRYDELLSLLVLNSNAGKFLKEPEKAKCILQMPGKEYNTPLLFGRTAANVGMKMGNGENPEKAYDGNILRMQQRGLKLRGSELIDVLQYQLKTIKCRD